jgi:hypothetical protein
MNTKRAVRTVAAVSVVAKKISCTRGAPRRMAPILESSNVRPKGVGGLLHYPGIQLPLPLIPIKRSPPPTLDYKELAEGACPDGGLHLTVVSVVEDNVAPAWCLKCGARAYDVPEESMIAVCHE